MKTNIEFFHPRKKCGGIGEDKQYNMVVGGTQEALS